MLNRQVFSLRLKLARVSADLTDSGRLFHTVGMATEKARSLGLWTQLGTIVNFSGMLCYFSCAFLAAVVFQFFDFSVTVILLTCQVCTAPVVTQEFFKICTHKHLIYK